MSEQEDFAECLDLLVLCVLEGDFASVTAAFSYFLYKTASLALMDIAP